MESPRRTQEEWLKQVEAILPYVEEACKKHNIFNWDLIKEAYELKAIRNLMAQLNKVWFQLPDGINIQTSTDFVSLVGVLEMWDEEEIEGIIKGSPTRVGTPLDPKMYPIDSKIQHP